MSFELEARKGGQGEILSRLFSRLPFLTVGFLTR